jgi:hypothetical protein
MSTTNHVIEDALRRIGRFRGSSITETIARIEKQLIGASLDVIRNHNSTIPIDRSLIFAAAQVKRASAQIDVVIHSAGILYSLPHILDPDEIVLSTSLGAGNAASEFDLVTDKRLAEFKFIYWQGGSESVRKKTFFQDYFKLVREPRSKAKYFYLLNTDVPLKFLSGKSASHRMLDRSAKLAADFEKRYGSKYPTVGDYYAAHKGEVCFVDLAKKVPALSEFIGLTDTEDETA